MSVVVHVPGACQKKLELMASIPIIILKSNGKHLVQARNHNNTYAPAMWVKKFPSKTILCVHLLSLI